MLVSRCTSIAQQQQNQTRYPSAVYVGPACPLTLNDIIKMSRAGVRDDATIAEFQKCDQHFQLSKNEIARLNNAGVSQKVIQAMIDARPSASAKAGPSGSTAPAEPVKSVPSAQPAGAAAQPADNPAVNTPSLSKPNQPALPSEPGLYVLAGQQGTKILGQPVTFERTGSRLVSTMTLTIKAAHDNIQLPGRHAQTLTSSKPTFVFVPSHNETENGVTGGDLLLVKLETHGDRRQIEIAAGGSWRASKGVSITHQLQVARSEPTSGVYEVTPAGPLKPGEYAMYLQRGEGLPAVLYDFSVQSVQ